MSNAHSLLSVAGALVDAGAYARVPLDADAAAADPGPAAAEIRRARVELYCDHNDAALSCIRAASGRLADLLPVGVAVAVALDLEVAARLTRQNKYLEAEQALEAALEHIGDGLGRHAAGHA